MIRWLVLFAISLAGILGPALAPYIFFEDRIDVIVEDLKEALDFQSSNTAIVELQSDGYRWPLSRDTISKVAISAIKDGAIAVGIDINMAIPTSKDEELLALVQRDKRVVALSLLQRPNEANMEGFVFDNSAKFIGVLCDDGSLTENQPFAIRLALAAGVSQESLYGNCVNSVLRPYVRSGAVEPPIVTVSEVLERNGTLQGRVVILGTANSFAGIATYNGIRSSTALVANVIESAFQVSWRQPHMPTSAFIYGALLLILYFIIQQNLSAQALLAHCSWLVPIAVAVRVWIWYPLLPVLALLAVALYIQVRSAPVDALNNTS